MDEKLGKLLFQQIFDTLALMSIDGLEAVIEECNRLIAIQKNKR